MGIGYLGKSEHWNKLTLGREFAFEEFAQVTLSEIPIERCEASLHFDSAAELPVYKVLVVAWGIVDLPWAALVSVVELKYSFVEKSPRIGKSGAGAEFWGEALSRLQGVILLLLLVVGRQE